MAGLAPAYNQPKSAPYAQKDPIPPREVLDAQRAFMKMEQARIGDCHTYALMLVSVAPMVISIWLGLNRDAIHFIGRGAFACFAVPALIFAQHVLQRYVKTPLKIQFVLSFWIVMAFFVIIGGVYMNEARRYAVGLNSENCGGQRPLQSAWDDAYEAYGKCVQRTQAYPRSVTACTEYQALEGRPEFDYLSKLELNHPCAGFCKSSQRLWWGADPPRKAAACRTFVRERLQIVGDCASWMTWYSVAVMVAVVPAFVFLSPIFDTMGYGHM